MSDNNIEIIDYEELFKTDEPNHEVEKKKDPHTSNLYTLIIYVLLFIVGLGSLITGMIIVNISPKSSTYVAISRLEDANNNNLLMFVPRLEYEEEIVKFKNQNDNIKYIVVENSIFNNEHVLIHKITNEVYLEFVSKQSNIDGILDGSILNWPVLEDSIVEYEINVAYFMKTEFYDLFNAKYDNFLLVEKLTLLQNNLILFSTYLLVFIPLIFINKNKIKDDYLIFNDISDKSFISTALTGLMYMLVANLLINIFVVFLSGIMGIEASASNQESIVKSLTSNGGILVAFTVVFIGPAVEELVFRKSIFGLIENQKVAFITSSISFGLIHLSTELINLFTEGGFTPHALAETFIVSIPYFGMGIFLSWFYKENNKNISLVIAVHALSNLLSVISVFLT